MVPVDTMRAHAAIGPWSDLRLGVARLRRQPPLNGGSTDDLGPGGEKKHHLDAYEPLRRPTRLFD